MGAPSEAAGPDFAAGIPIGDLPGDGTLAGRVGKEAVLLSRFGEELAAVGGSCTHYGAPLAEGMAEGETVRCPWHHACFSLRDGAALRAPALDGLARWRVEREGDMVFVRGKLEPAEAPAAVSTDVERVVIVGGGAAGLACANELRRLGFAGSIAMLSADPDPPCDRPNLSKDYLAGSAPEEWLPLRSDDWYAQNRVELKLGAEVRRLDAAERQVHFGAGERMGFDRLLIATGSEPNRLRSPGFDCEQVHTLRTIADSRAIAAAAGPGARAAVIGSSFIGLEAAAALRKRGAEVAVVSPEHVPFEGVFGAELGGWLQRLHESHGVRFHLGTVAAAFENGRVKLADGGAFEADLVLVGIGVRPRTAVAETAGIDSADGVRVDEYLETSSPGIFAAGDIASYPDPLTGERTRVEHWVVAERQGQVAAANMLGQRKRFDAVPFFWTEQFGVQLRYVGQAVRWDRVEVDGDIESGDFLARYHDGDAHRASAGAGRDRAMLDEERRFERMIAEARRQH